MEDVLLYFAMKYDGDFKKMLYALQTKEQTDSHQLEEYKKDVRHKYVTLVSNHYPDYFKTVECPPIVLFYKGNWYYVKKKYQSDWQYRWKEILGMVWL